MKTYSLRLTWHFIRQYQNARLRRLLLWLQSLREFRTGNRRPTPLSLVARPSDMEWTFPDGGSRPLGSDRKFSVGFLKGKTFIDVTMETPQQYFSIYKSTTLSAEAKEYVEWVKKNFDLNLESKLISLKKNSTSQGCASASVCQHEKVHHKGSSARYRKSTCQACGEVWQEERDKCTNDPQTCQHRRTDHRGSNKVVRKTYCLECGEYIDSIAQEIAKELSTQPNLWISEAEQVLLDRVNEHDTISKEQIICAAEIMLADAHRLEEGE